jgi:uncharacterized protein YnzC (UPF0291/DUF896 family)
VRKLVTPEMIERINELARKKKTTGLNEDEQAEQKVLYREYIEAFKANLRAQLEMIEVVDEVAEDVVDEMVEEEIADDIVDEIVEEIAEEIIDEERE